VTEDRSSPSTIVHRVLLETEVGISVPLLLLSPKDNNAPPVVLAVSQAGKELFLSERSRTVTGLLRSGIAVCLPDVRGTGETREGNARGRTSGDTNRSVNMQMFGETLVGQRLRDLRSVLIYLRDRGDLDVTRVALWGDSFVAPNSTDIDFRVPHGVAGRARQCEPLGGLLALLTALFEEDVDAVYIHKGLGSYLSVLDEPHVYVPHDAVVPQALNAGDLSDIAAALAPTRLRLSGMVDALNRPLSEQQVRRAYHRVPSAQLEVTNNRESSAVAWLVEAIK
jgi:hypothetical protein